MKMKLGLVSCLVKDNDIEHQLKQIERYTSLNHNCDLICFGESFLQGFDGLTWNYGEDIERAVAIDDAVIDAVRELAKTSNCGISFGFVERDKSFLYSSNMVIDSYGEVVDVFRRITPGWKEPRANSMYKEGQEFHTFKYTDKVLGTAICGDIWDDHLLKCLEGMKMDALLWPVYIDYSVTQWNEMSQKEYAERTRNLPYPVLMINSFYEDNDRAKGGCYVFHQNRIVQALPLGNTGVLEFELD